MRKKRRFTVRRCRVCKCTEDHACEGGCYWVFADLCSSCVPPLTATKVKRQ